MLSSSASIQRAIVFVAAGLAALSFLTGCSHLPDPGPQTSLSPAQVEQAKQQIQTSHLSPTAEAAALAELKRKSQ